MVVRETKAAACLANARGPRSGNRAANRFARANQGESDSPLLGPVQDDLTPHVNKSRNPANCNSGSMLQVIVPKDFGNALVTVLTLGMWVPMEVEWRCGGDGTSKPSASLRQGVKSPARVLLVIQRTNATRQSS
jgi:hypothetical protein